MLYNVLVIVASMLYNVLVIVASMLYNVLVIVASTHATGGCWYIEPRWKFFQAIIVL